MSREIAAVPVQRLIVPDVLRGIAIVAMLIAHAVPFLPEASGLLRFVMGNVNDLASPLFALVMGMSTQLVWRASARIGRAMLQQVVRGLVLIILGVWMATWGSWVAIVLAPLGLLLLVGAPILLLRTRWVAVITAATGLISAPLNALAREQAWLLTSGPIVRSVADWTVLGASYRLTNLLPFFLLGALLLRGGLARGRTTWTMLAIAPIAYLVRPLFERLTGTDYVSGSYPDTLHDVGLVFVTFVVVVLLASADRGRKVIERLLSPFRLWGRLALSLYLLHIAVIVAWRGAFGHPTRTEMLGWVLVVVAPLAAAWLWGRFVGTGPVEWALGVVSGRRKSLRQQLTPNSAAPLR